MVESEEDVELGPVVHVRSLWAAIRRRWRVVAIAGLVGLIVGASLHLVLPRKYVATSDLFLAVPAGSNPEEAMANNLALLHTNAVAEKAIVVGGLTMSPHTLLSRFSGLSLSDDIMSITYSASTSGQAVAGARAVAHAFLSVQSGELRRQTNGLVHSLRSQITSLNASIATLDAQIVNPATGASGANNQLTNLINQRSDDQSQVSQLQGQIGEAVTQQQASNSVSHVLDPATVPPSSKIKVFLVDGLSGLVAGLAVGVILIVFGALFSEKVPGRAMVVEALGAPVALSLARYRSPRLLRRSRLARRLHAPDPAISMIGRRLRSQLELAPGSAMAIITMGAPDAAALGVGSLALALSSEGHRVVVVDAADDRLLASTLGLSPTPDTMELSPVPTDEPESLRLIVAPPDPMQMAEAPPDDADTLLVLASLDPAFGAEHLASWVVDAVVVLSEPGVSLVRMDVGRQMLRRAGISLRSVILLGSDAEDESSGARNADEHELTPADRGLWPN